MGIRKGDVRRAVAEVQATGAKVKRVEIEGGKIVIVVAGEGENDDNESIVDLLK
jgi:hypothetical protein